MSDDVRLPAEQQARVLIDSQLAAAGWVVQDGKALNLFASIAEDACSAATPEAHGASIESLSLLAEISSVDDLLWANVQQPA